MAEAASLSKAEWKKRNDAGPHKAVLPSGLADGSTVTIQIPDDSALLVVGRMRDELRKVAILVAGHPGGAEGYMGDLVTHAMLDAAREQQVVETIELGLEIQAELIAEMLVVPKVTAAEVLAGDFPAMDIRMLIEFAERRRGTDAAGNRLPIVTLDSWARFRGERDGVAGAGESGPGGHEPGSDVSGADEGAV